MSDTDSFLLYCQGIENLETIVENHKDRFDLSNLQEGHRLRNLDNCTVLGKWKVTEKCNISTFYFLFSSSFIHRLNLDWDLS